MKDYKGIHREFQRQEHDYREGWREERDGIWLLIGMALIGVCVVIGAMA